MVSSVIMTGRSELSKMAEGHPDHKQKASQVKEFKRFLCHKRTTYKNCYLAFISEFLYHISHRGSLVFSIDGSVVGNGCMCLMFSVIYKGRAIPVVWKTYKSKKGHLSESKHIELLNNLAEIVPENCRIVMTGDGEFDGCDWQKCLLDLGWDYVLRTAKDTLIEDENGEKFQLQTMLVDCKYNPITNSIFFENIEFTTKKKIANILVWHAAKHKKPLYLVTNLDYAPEIKQFYKKRFKIEFLFKDLKSSGFHINKSRLRHPKRLDNLIIVLSIAYIIAIKGGEKALKSKFYKLIAQDKTKPLSLFQTGYLFLKKLVDLRQWREFNINKDIQKDYTESESMEIYVPF